MDHPQGEDQRGADQPAQGALRQEFRREIELAEHVHGMEAHIHVHIKVDYKTILTVTVTIPIALAIIVQILGHAPRITVTYSGSQATTQTQIQPTAQSKSSLILKKRAIIGA